MNYRQEAYSTIVADRYRWGHARRRRFLRRMTKKGHACLIIKEKRVLVYDIPAIMWNDWRRQNPKH